MAFAAAEIQNKILDNIFERFNDNTLVCRQVLVDEFKQITNRGYAVCNE